MSRVVFLLDERSMKTLLDGLIPRLFPDLPFLCVPHEGKRDLELSIPRKLRAWQEPGVRFVVIRDNVVVTTAAGSKLLSVDCVRTVDGKILWYTSLVRSWRPGISESRKHWRMPTGRSHCASDSAAPAFANRTRFSARRQNFHS